MKIFFFLINTFLLYKIWSLSWFIPYLDVFFVLVFFIQCVFYKKITEYKFQIPFSILSFLLVLLTFPASANHYFLLLYLYLGILLAKIFKEDEKRVISIIIGLSFLMAGTSKLISSHYRSGSFIGQSILSQRLYDKIIPDEYIVLTNKDQVELYKNKKVELDLSSEFKIFVKSLVVLSILYQFILSILLILNINYYSPFFILHYAITILGTTEYIFGTILCLCFYLLTKKKYYLIFVLSLLLMEYL